MNHAATSISQDANDFTPAFSAETYTQEDVLETLPVGTTIAEVEVSDGDAEGVNSEVRFRLFNVDPQQATELFEVNSQTGSVRLARPFTDNSADRYTVNCDSKEADFPYNILLIFCLYFWLRWSWRSPTWGRLLARVAQISFKTSFATKTLQDSNPMSIKTP